MNRADMTPSEIDRAEQREWDAEDEEALDRARDEEWEARRDRDELCREDWELTTEWLGAPEPYVTESRLVNRCRCCGRDQTDER